MTQAQLAELAEINVQTISNYEAGSRWPQADLLDLLARALRVRPWQLIAEDDEGASIPPDLVEHVASAAQACGLRVSRPK